MLWGLVAAPQQLAELQLWAERQQILCSREDECLWLCGAAAQRAETAGELARCFYGIWQAQLLQELAEQMFAHRPAAEQREIAQRAAELGRLLLPARQERELAGLCLCFWQRQPRLHLGGLVRFLLPGYGGQLRALLYEAADALLQQQEEQEYWALLAAHLRQARGGAQLHLFFDGDSGGSYRLCMAAPRGWRCLEGGVLAGYEDLLLLNLLRLAPQQLVLHAPLPPGTEKLRGMIERVFGERVVVQPDE